MNEENLFPYDDTDEIRSEHAHLYSPNFSALALDYVNNRSEKSTINTFNFGYVNSFGNVE